MTESRRTWVDGGAKEVGFNLLVMVGGCVEECAGGLRRCFEMGEEGFVMWWFDVAIPRVFG
jgi:hypothetical protein